MDPFREDFDAQKALSLINCIDVNPCSSLEEFEENLIKEDPTLVSGILKIEKDATTSNEAQKLTTKKRLKGLEAVCKESAEPTVPKPVKIAKRRVKHIDTAEGKAFACASGGIYDCMEKWVNERSRVTIKIRNDATSRTHAEPNRLLQGVIVAFDKHWNLVLRDVDEVYTPALRLRKVQASSKAMPSSVVYNLLNASSSGPTVMQRHLKCSMVVGNSIVCIYKE
ncbi:LSM domain-containing protein [Ditylenchus destructor]|uniref:LSM domain-containing protein n=1 Tax=Ditylenchus destructor TaxID=166010 RepID=A0AAD4R6X3_9BILA|nr:LSM domain-containing protein [Ditylenchus destructor]